MPKDFRNYRMNGCFLEPTPSAAPALKVKAGGALPPRVDLRPHCSPVEDQGNLNSCAGNAVVGALEYHQRKSGQRVADLSRLFVYYNARKIGGTETEDEGTYIHHVMAAVMAFGACPEQTWPYDEAKCKVKPEDPCYESALNFSAISYARTGFGGDAKSAVAAGLPIVFGTSLPGEMLQVEGALTGMIKRPEGGWPPIPNSGHAMVIVGYDDGRNAWLVRNSWGPGFGEGGHVWIDYDVMTHYSHPHGFWTVGAIEANPDFAVSGPSKAQAVAATRAAAPEEVRMVLSDFKHALGTDISRSLSDAKQGMRNRLRGPGVGGGY